MPVYNGAQWLSAALESVLAQTLSNLELLIVDDASVDDTARIAERFATRDRRVQLLRHASNRGQAAARNLALGKARGAWIAPVDADDEIRPERLRVLVECEDLGRDVQEHSFRPSLATLSSQPWHGPRATRGDQVRCDGAELGGVAHPSFDGCP